MSKIEKNKNSTATVEYNSEIVSENQAKILECFEKIKSAKKISNPVLREKYIKTYEDMIDKLKKEEQKSFKPGLVSLLSIILALVLAYGIGRTSVKNQTVKATPASTPIATVVPIVDENEELGKETNITAEQEEIIARVVKEFPEAREVIEKSGLFLDATNDEQVEARAQAIYDVYFAEPLAKINEVTKDWNEKDKPVYLSMFTPEEIANYIRWRNNVLPKENGYSVYAVDGSTQDKYITMGAQMSNMSSDGKYFDKPFFIPTCLMNIDGSKDQSLSLLWNKDYNDITKVMNGESTLGSEYVLYTLGEDLRDRALFAGRDGKLTFWDLNNVNSNQYAIVQDALNPFERVVEWYLSPRDRKNAAEIVCLEVCTNYKTGKPEIYSLAELYNAVINVRENEIIHQMAGVEFTGKTIEKTFYDAQHEKFMKQKDALGNSYTNIG